MTPHIALAALEDRADPAKAASMAAYHKAPRRYLGVANPVIDALVRDWRAECDMPGRLALAEHLWQSDIHEARIAAGKLLTQARIPRHEPATWQMIAAWVPDFDAWAIADHAASAGARRLRAHPERLDEVEDWTRSDHLWTRRAALVFTLPWAKSNHPDAAEQAQRDRILGWAASLLDDRAWFIQKAVAWWIRDLSKHDIPRAAGFLAKHGDRMKPFARREAAKYLPRSGQTPP